MKSERMELAKQLLGRKNSVGKDALPMKANKPPVLQQPHIGKYSDIHPEVLDHVHRYLQEFKKGLSRGK